MKATAGSEVVTPLTTLVATLVEKGQTVDQAQTAVKTAFGIDSTVDLTKLDHLGKAGHAFKQERDKLGKFDDRPWPKGWVSRRRKEGV